MRKKKELKMGRAHFVAIGIMVVMTVILTFYAGHNTSEAFKAILDGAEVEVIAPEQGLEEEYKWEQKNGYRPKNELEKQRKSSKGQEMSSLTRRRVPQQEIKLQEFKEVRPAIVLAILHQESRFGQDLGDGHWKKDMHPRDRQAFRGICLELGKNPNKTPVSAKPSYGWGGAMGPAQFLPKTWLEYESQVAEVTGHKPDPWDINDAYIAASLKLKNDGVGESEIKAVRKYFAGSNHYKFQYRWYSRQVMAKAQRYQKYLEQNPAKKKWPD